MTGEPSLPKNAAFIVGITLVALIIGGRVHNSNHLSDDRYDVILSRRHSYRAFSSISPNGIPHE
jgi:hypothetical protein